MNLNEIDIDTLGSELFGCGFNRYEIDQMTADRFQHIENETENEVPDENNDLDEQNITPYNPSVSVPPSFNSFLLRL